MVIPSKAIKEIDEFKKAFYDKYNIALKISSDETHLNKVPLDLIEKAVNFALSYTTAESYSTIRQLNNDRELSNARYVFYKIAFEYNYKVTQISSFFCTHHSNVSTGRKKADTFLSLKDPYVTKIYKLALNEISHKLSSEPV